MNLVYFTQTAYKMLKKDIEVNRDRYYSDEAWLEKYFEDNDLTEFTINTSISVGNFDFQFTGDDSEHKNADDLQNTIMLYSTYKDKITPSQASDPCLWTALSHISYRDYIIKRWMKDGSISLYQRFFATEGRSSLLYYNAISRLWWSGYLTYDDQKEKSNPWELTKTLFSAQQIQKDLFDQPYSMNKRIVKGLLHALGRIQEETGNASTSIFRKCCDSYVNHYGAVTILDTLEAEEIEQIAYEYMKSHISQG